MKKHIIFEQTDLHQTESIKADKHFTSDEQENFQPILDDEDTSIPIESILKPKSSIWRKLVLVGFAVLVISFVIQGIERVIVAWTQQSWSSLLLISAMGLIVIAGLGTLIREWRRLYRLRERADERETAQTLLQSYGLVEGRLFCEKLAKQAKIDPAHPAFIRWQAALHESHHDKEVIQLYAKLVQPILDRKVRAEISRYAAESAVMVAISPFTLVDMMLVAWRNFRLINRIAGLYGIELGYFSRLRLFRLVLVNIAFAGASELVQDMGIDWLSQDLTARISTRVAQGVGVGLLTARLGIKSMELCRPLPWIDNDKPKLTEFRKDLLSYLKVRISNRVD